MCNQVLEMASDTESPCIPSTCPQETYWSVNFLAHYRKQQVLTAEPGAAAGSDAVLDEKSVYWCLLVSCLDCTFPLVPSRPPPN